MMLWKEKSDWLQFQKSSSQKQLGRFDYGFMWKLIIWSCTSFWGFFVNRKKKMAAMAILNSILWENKWNLFQLTCTLVVHVNSRSLKQQTWLHPRYMWLSLDGNCFMRIRNPRWPQQQGLVLTKYPVRKRTISFLRKKQDWTQTVYEWSLDDPLQSWIF